MKKLIFLFVLVVLALSSIAQSNNVERLKIYASGSATLVNGECKVSFDKISDMDTYVVLLTPVNGFAELYVASKNDNSFIVKAKDASNVAFEYVIFTKRVKQKQVNDNSKKVE